MFKFCEKCKTDQEIGIDKSTLDANQQVTKDTIVVCLVCKGKIDMSLIMTRTLKSMCKFYEKPRITQPFSFKCAKCDEIVPALLSPDKTKASCTKCGDDLKISKIMLTAMNISKSKGGIDPA